MNRFKYAYLKAMGGTWKPDIQDIYDYITNHGGNTL